MRYFLAVHLCLILPQLPESSVRKRRGILSFLKFASQSSLYLTASLSKSSKPDIGHNKDLQPPGRLMKQPTQKQQNYSLLKLRGRIPRHSHCQSSSPLAISRQQSLELEGLASIHRHVLNRPSVFSASQLSALPSSASRTPSQSLAIHQRSPAHNLGPRRQLVLSPIMHHQPRHTR